MNLIFKSPCYKIGDGQNINLGMTFQMSWVEGKISKLKADAQVVAANFINYFYLSQDEEALKSLFDYAIVEAICKLELISFAFLDKILWNSSKDDVSLVRDAYNLLVDEGSQEVWKETWQSKLHEGLKLFLWLLALECLLKKGKFGLEFTKDIIYAFFVGKRKKFPFAFFSWSSSLLRGVGLYPGYGLFFVPCWNFCHVNCNSVFGIYAIGPFKHQKL